MGDFEKDLQNAFEGAEFIPSPKVWQGVQAGLAPKKKGVFYMWQTYGVAAAILLVLTMGFLLLDRLSTVDNGGVATEELAEKEGVTKTGPDNSNSEKESGVGAPAGLNNQTDSARNQMVPDQRIVANKADFLADNTSEVISNEVTQIEFTTLSGKTNNSGTTLVSSESAESDVFTPGISQGTENAMASFDAALAYAAIPKPSDESMAQLRLRWELKHLVGPMEIDSAFLKQPVTEEIVASRTSLNGNFGSGNFNPNGSGFSAMDDAAVENFAQDPQAGRFNIVNGDETQLGSLSVGAGIGFELNRRWLLRLGLRYSQYRYASTTNAYALEDGEALPLNSNVSFDDAEVRFAGEYEVTNTIHSVSVPVQFGYRILDRSRFDIILNAGVGVDYFVNYTVKGDLNFLETRNVDIGESDYLNRFNVNVLTGLELGYQLNDKFGLSGELFFRQYIPSLNPQETGAQATPSFLGFGLGVNYFLRKKK